MSSQVSMKPEVPSFFHVIPVICVKYADRILSCNRICYDIILPSERKRTKKNEAEHDGTYQLG